MASHALRSSHNHPTNSPSVTQNLPSIFVLIPPPSPSLHALNSPVPFCSCSLILKDTHITCSSSNCPIKNFHRACVGISDDFIGDWKCSSCASIRRGRPHKTPRQVQILYAATDESVVESVIEMSLGLDVDPKQRTRAQREGEASEGVMLTEEEEMRLRSIIEETPAQMDTTQDEQSQTSVSDDRQDSALVEPQVHSSADQEDTLMEDATFDEPIDSTMATLDGPTLTNDIPAKADDTLFDEPINSEMVNWGGPTLTNDIPIQAHPNTISAISSSLSPYPSSILSEDQHRHAQLIGYEAASSLSPPPLPIRRRGPGWRLISIEEDEARRAIAAGFFVPIVFEREDGRMVLRSFVRKMREQGNDMGFRV